MFLCQQVLQFLSSLRRIEVLERAVRYDETVEQEGEPPSDHVPIPTVKNARLLRNRLVASRTVFHPIQRVRPYEMQVP